MRSVLKAYSAENETFLNDIKNQYADIGFNQDEIIKLVFLLQDDHVKDIIEIDQADSDFITTKSERIKMCLEGTRAFLKHAGLYEYIINSQTSLIPITFIAYHLFHTHKSDSDLKTYFDNHETGNENYSPIRNWLIMSLLNHVFQRGSGWTPNTTGRKKILNVLRNFKNQIFPVEEIFTIYENHSLHVFHRNIKDNGESLNWYERGLIVYLLYGKPTNFRQNDIDHIHPKAILLEKGFEWANINLLGNFQYLYYRDNRSKQATEFGMWLEGLFGTDKQKLNDYLNIHFIPNNEELWYTDKFLEFLEERRLLIFNKLNQVI